MSIAVSLTASGSHGRERETRVEGLRRNHQARRCWPAMNALSKYHDWLPASWCRLASHPETNSSSSGMASTCKVAPSVASSRSVTSQYCSGTVKPYRHVTWHAAFSPALTGFRLRVGKALLGTRDTPRVSSISTLEARFSSENV